MDIPRAIRRLLKPARDRVRRTLRAHDPLHHANYSRLAILEAHFEALCRVVHHGVFVTEPGGALTFANDRVRQMFGFPAEGDPSIEATLEIVHPEDRGRVRSEWRTAIKGGEEFASEHRLVGREGKMSVVRAFASPVRCEYGIVGYVGTIEDVTRLKATEELLRESQRRLETITDHVPAVVCYVDADERYQYVNRAFEDAYGLPRESVLGRRMSEVLDPKAYVQARSIKDKVDLEGRAVAERCMETEGGKLWLHTAVVAHRAPDGSLLGYFALSTDITARREAEDALFREKERVLVTLSSISDAVATVDADGTIDYLNPTAERLTGWTLGEARGLPAETVIAMLPGAAALAVHPLRTALSGGGTEGDAPLAATLQRRGALPLQVDLSVAAIRHRDGPIDGAIAIFRDATSQRRLARRLAWQATHDALTRLRNRCGFTEALESALAQPGLHALLAIDLDRFKAINDSCGHAAGDEVLRLVARRLEDAVRTGDVVARMGGDEFLVLLHGCTPEAAHAVAEKMRAAIESIRHIHEGREYRIGASIGVAACEPGPGVDADSLLKRADQACYAAKSGGRNCVVAFVPRLVA